ncbi:MAG: hypothetical protein ABSH13_05745 [Candidatus Acidiferrum sp.]|jgi:hypothetical protein
MNTNYTVVRGLVAPTPETQPTTIDELVERAIAEHLKFHADDGSGLFIWATPDVTGAPLYTYPISAADPDLALEIAKACHEWRGILPSGEWILVFAWEQDNLPAVGN